jgi:hypothetical protein
MFIVDHLLIIYVECFQQRKSIINLWYINILILKSQVLGKRNLTILNQDNSAAKLYLALVLMIA